MKNEPEEEDAQGRTDFGMNTGQVFCVSLSQYNAIAVIDIFKERSIP